MNTSEFGLGRRPSPIDIRDYKLADFMPPDLGDLTGSMVWPFNALPLDQGNTPHCVGFGGANWEISDPVQDIGVTNKTGHNIYYKCKVLDGEPGAEDGSDVRTLAKVLQSIGRIKNYAWAANTDEITYWLLHQGPVIVGTEWYDSMFQPDADNVLKVTGSVVGGHCYLLNAVHQNKTYQIHNSWGSGWGINGEALISVEDFAALLEYGGEAMTSVELPLTAEKQGCLPALLKAFGLGSN